MGICVTKMIGKKKKHMTKSPPTIDFRPHDIKIPIDLDSYKAVCIQTLDGSLVARTNRVIASLGPEIEVKALSFDSLKEVTELHMDMNQEVVKVVLEFKQDIRENPELLELVKEYFENSTQTLNFCSELEKCLERAKDSQSLMLEALRVFNEESGLEGGNIRCVKTMEELKKFKATGYPFPDDFIKNFQSFRDHQNLMLTKLVTRKKQLEEKLNTSQVWRMVCSIIFAAMISGVLIFSVVGVAIAAPPVGVAVAAASEPLLACMGTCINSRCKKCKNAVKGQMDVIQSMEGYVGSRIAIAELDNIYEIIENLDINIKYLLKNEEEEEEGGCDVVKEEEVKKEIEEINKKMEVFKRDVELLGKHTCKCIQDVQRARTEVILSPTISSRISNPFAFTRI